MSPSLSVIDCSATRSPQYLTHKFNNIITFLPNRLEIYEKWCSCNKQHDAEFLTSKHLVIKWKKVFNRRLDFWAIFEEV